MSIRSLMKTARRRWLKVFGVFKILRNGRLPDEKVTRFNRIVPKFDENRRRHLPSSSCEACCEFPAPSKSATPPFPRYFGKTRSLRSLYENVNTSRGYDSAYDSDDPEYIDGDEQIATKEINDGSFQNYEPVACESIAECENVSCEKFENIWNETVESLVL